MRKSVPAYWWDFDANGDVVVQGNRAGGECLSRFSASGAVSASVQIAAAESLIADFNAGRKTPAWHTPH